MYDDKVLGMAYRTKCSVYQLLVKVNEIDQQLLFGTERYVCGNHRRTMRPAIVLNGILPGRTPLIGSGVMVLHIKALRSRRN
jgi:hypothetical protein